jgi:hypothetical protein
MSVHERWQDEEIDGIDTTLLTLDWAREWTIDIVYENLIILPICYDDKFRYGFYVWKLLILFLSVDASMVTHSNPTQIWNKGVIHIYLIDEGVVRQCQCHCLLALQPWSEVKFNDYLVPEKFIMSWGQTEIVAHMDFRGARNKANSLFLSKTLVSHKVDKWSIDSKH